MVKLENIIRAMSLALDLTQVSGYAVEKVVEETALLTTSDHTFMHHSKRTNFIALSIGRELGLSENTQTELYVSSLLHDIGAISSLKISHNKTAFIKEHCIKGSEIIKSFPYFKNVSELIHYHHENWDGSGAFGLSHDEIPLLCQIMRISDLVEIIYNEEFPSYLQKDKICQWVISKKGTLFSENIVEAFLNVSTPDMFWFDMETIGVMEYPAHLSYPSLDIDLSLEEFKKVAYIFSKIIDSKSKFTAKHSYGISELAYKVSKYLKFDDEKCLKMKIAGLLHDIGKLAIPNRILDKPGSLTSEEFSIIKSHAYYTKIILEMIDGIGEISDWASNHHEKLNGKGYPQSLKEDELSLESRIMAVCDVYQALTEDRPYRKGLEQEKAFNILDSMVADNFLCGNAVSLLKETLNYSK